MRLQFSRYTRFFRQTTLAAILVIPSVGCDFTVQEFEAEASTEQHRASDAPEEVTSDTSQDVASDAPQEVASDAPVEQVGSPMVMEVSNDSSASQGACLPRIVAPQPELVVLDTDGDGLPDTTELMDHGTDPTVRDTDRDGINDFQEVQAGTNPTIAGTADNDGDGVPNVYERALGTPVNVPNPTDADEDGDGLSDVDEAVHKTNPLNADSDNDGLDDGAEVHQFGSNPTLKDTDEDGVKDGHEVELGFDPTFKNMGDSDNDNVSNVQEAKNGTDPTDADTDSDGLNDKQELNLGTDGSDDDTDDDGLSDGAEVAAKTNPLKADTDGDGINDADELTQGGDPTNPDSDGDKIPDGLEVAQGTNPLVADTADTDGDSVPDAMELALGTDPAVKDGAVDSDGDGISNRLELLHGLHPGRPDVDGDLLLDGEEIAAGTDPKDPDTDRDGIPDGWEVHGHEGVDYASLGCDPLKRDLLVEIDYQYEEVPQPDGSVEIFSQRPGPALVQKIEDTFANMPIDNPDGSTGIRIKLISDTPLHPSYLCYDGGGDASGYNNPGRHSFRLAFHKATLCKGNQGFIGNSHISGRSLKLKSPQPDNDCSNDLTERAQLLQYAVFMHELGHSLGLRHGGNVEANHKPNYPSLMNYLYDKSLYDSPMTLKETLISFSDGEFPVVLDECNLTEKFAVPGASYDEALFMADPGGFNVVAGPDVDVVNDAGELVTVQSFGVDFDEDGAIEDGPYAKILRKDATSCKTLKDHNDFERIADRMALALPSNPGSEE